jgi:uncharacterized protein YecE (DUF72 family)
MTAEGSTSLSLDTLEKTLDAQNMHVDEQELRDLLDSIPVVNTIKDDVVFFNNDGDVDAPDPEKQDKTVAKLAKKKVDKEMSK